MYFSKITYSPPQPFLITDKVTFSFLQITDLTVHKIWVIRSTLQQGEWSYSLWRALISFENISKMTKALIVNENYHAPQVSVEDFSIELNQSIINVFIEATAMGRDQRCLLSK